MDHAAAPPGPAPAGPGARKCVAWTARLRAVGPGWRAAALVIGLGVLAPVLSLLWLAASGSAFPLPSVAPALGATLALLAGVGLLVVGIGTGCAWLVTAYDFPGRGWLGWALLLPLAMPTYIVAFAYVDLLHPLGPVQGLLRWALGLDSPRQLRLPDVRSLGTAIVAMGLVLYPYVYLTTRAMFQTQPAQLLEAARCLGAGPWGRFWRLALPMARPAIAVGTALALLETLNDVGASEFLGVNTLTVAVYTTWVNRSDLHGAAQIACLMLVAVLAMVGLERAGRRQRRFATGRGLRPLQPQRLGRTRGWLAFGLACTPVLLGFVAPAAWLLVESARRVLAHGGVSPALAASLFNTVALALGVTAGCVAAGLVVGWASRSTAPAGRAAPLPARLAALGYALPGTVLAVGLLTPAIALDSALAAWLGLPGLPLMGAGVVLVAACVMRYLAIPVGGVEAGLARIAPALEQAARALGAGATDTLRRVHLPLLRPALASSALLVFVEVMKELPATLLLRPANFETLSTWLYGEAARGTYEEGAIAALAIVLVSLLPVILLTRTPRTP